jgi:hypothetical protein
MNFSFLQIQFACGNSGKERSPFLDAASTGNGEGTQEMVASKFDTQHHLQFLFKQQELLTREIQRVTEVRGDRRLGCYDYPGMTLHMY